MVEVKNDRSLTLTASSRGPIVIWMRRQSERRSFLMPGRKGGIPLFRVLGIQVYAHYSWFLIVALIAGSLTIGWFPAVLPDRSFLQYAALGGITTFFFFASVFVHELSHSVVAIARGIPVRRITLFLFGGVAEISREPDDPGTELRMALAGPAMSAALAFVFWSIFALMGAETPRPALRLAFFYLAFANTFLLTFNILPGLPLDGGRVLRALIWRSTGDLRRATYVSSLAGKALSGLIMLVGIAFIFFLGSLATGVWLIVIALFLRQAAEASYRQMIARLSLGGVRVRDAMTQNVVSVPPDISLDELVEDFFLTSHHICYPVLEGDSPVGLVTIRDVKHVGRESWGTTRVADVMTRLGRDTTLTPDEPLVEAMQKMSAEGCGRLPVVEDGRLAGILTRRDVMTHLQIRNDLAS